MQPSFAGVSVVSGGKLCPCAELSADTCADYGYHLLVVQDYTTTKRRTPTGKSIISRSFIVGEHEWYIRFFPSGDKPSCANFISLYLCRLTDDDDDDDDHKTVDAKFSFSFIDQVDKHKPGYIHGTKTCSFSRTDTSWGMGKFTRRDALEQSHNMKYDGFTIRCDVIVCNTEVAATLSHDMFQHFNNLLQTKVGVDVTFEVNGETFAAHRCVLAARSTVFMAQLFGPVKEGTSTSSVIQIEDMEARVFGALLSFIYADSFPKMEKDDMEEDEAHIEDEGEIRVQWLQDLFVAADRYDLQRLKFMCEKHLSEHIGVSSVSSTLALAEQHHCRGLKETCLRFIQSLSPSCLQEIMESNGWEYLMATYPSVLNELIIKLSSKRCKNC